MNNLALLAIFAGVSIGLQAAMNARLGVILKSPMLSAITTFIVASIGLTLVALFSEKNFPGIHTIRSVSWYLWFAGCLSAFGVASFYFLIPKMGVGPMMAFALTGQLATAVILSHFGLFDLPVRTINPTKIIGLISMVIGILLVNYEN